MKPKAETTAVPLAVIGVDIGKDVFHLVGLGVGRKDCLQEEDQATGPQRRVVRLQAVLLISAL